MLECRTHCDLSCRGKELTLKSVFIVPDAAFHGRRIALQKFSIDMPAGRRKAR